MPTNLANQESNGSEIFILYLKWFIMFGIEIYRTKVNIIAKFILPTIRFVVKFYWLYMFLYLLSSFYIAIIDDTEIKSILARMLLILCSYLIWWHVIKNETVVNRGIKKLQNFLKVLEIPPNNKLIFIACTLSAITFITSMVLFAYNYSKNRSRYFMRIHTFGTVENVHEDSYLSLILWHTYNFSLHYGVSFAWHFTMFYIFICRYMTVILYKHIEISKIILRHRSIQPVDYEACFIRYDAIIATFKKIKSKLSHPAFLMSCYQTSGVLFATLNIIKIGSLRSPADALTFATNFTLFTGITFAASSVNEADKLAKETNFKVLRLFISENGNQAKVNVEILSHICHAPAFALSGWNFFEYTRGFYLTAVGCLMTYSLLIIEL